MDVYLLQHVSHRHSPDGVHFMDGELRIDEQAGDQVFLLGCYSTPERAQDRIVRARSLPGFADEPECFIVDRYVLDRDEWTSGYEACDGPS